MRLPCGTATLAAIAGLGLLGLRLGRWLSSSPSPTTSKASSYTTHLVSLRRDGLPLPRGRSAVAAMQSAFFEDIRRLAHLNQALAVQRGLDSFRRLRVMSFNVHFFRRGCSGTCGPSNAEDVLDIVARFQPDVLLLQEVPPASTVLGALAHKHGFAHQVCAGSPAVHILPDESKFGEEARGKRLEVCVCSRLPFLQSGRAPLGETADDGFAAFGTVDLTGKDLGGASPSPAVPETLTLYSTHLSVRCPGEKRLAETRRLLKDSEERKACIIAGDFNQPSELDYPPEQWGVMAEDMVGAGLPTDDGAATAMMAAGFRHAFDRVPVGRRPGFSTWNGALVDFAWLRPGATKLKVATAGLVYTDASDHLPLVVDYISHYGNHHQWNE